MKNVIAWISAGESSGMLAYLLKKQEIKGLINVRYVFMNTGQEDERTLIFADQLDKYFGLNLTWLEAVVDKRKNKGIRHKIVTFETACRNGTVFESHIAKYGLPSSKAPHCTRDLKGNCCLSWINTLGLGDNYEIAIGFRYDEPSRVNLIKAQIKKQWYPLYEKKIVKADVKAFWSKQPFQLEIKEYEGNCKMCFKKSKRKLLTQMLINPKYIQWYVDMQLKYPNDTKGKPTVMFRGKESIFDLIEQSKAGDFELWTEPIGYGDANFDIELDEQEQCGGSSCEPFQIEDFELINS